MDGFLPGSRGTFMMDTVVTAMALVLPALTVSIRRAKGRDYRGHKRIQMVISTVLLLVVLLFEIEVRTRGWQDRALPSPYFTHGLFPFLYVHLTLAISTTVLWSVTLVLGLRRFANPPRPGTHSELHKKLGWAAALTMYLTALTGWTFFWMAFVAT